MATALHPKQDHKPNTSRTPLRKWLLGPLFASSVGGKAVVAVTGLALTLFVLGHLTGNLLFFSGPDVINGYAEFLKEKPFLLWAARLGLLGAFVLHVSLALRLNWISRRARPVRYAYEKTAHATWESRHMVSTGILVGIFVLFHLAHYTGGWVKAARLEAPTLAVVGSAGGKEVVSEVAAGTKVNYLDLRQKVAGHGYRHDVYSMVYYGFKNEWITLAYLVAQVALLLHLSHGIASTLQSLGLNSARWAPVVRLVGRTVALLLFVGNVSIPLYVFLGAHYGFVHPTPFTGA